MRIGDEMKRRVFVTLVLWGMRWRLSHADCCQDSNSPWPQSSNLVCKHGNSGGMEISKGMRVSAVSPDVSSPAAMADAIVSECRYFIQCDRVHPFSDWSEWYTGRTVELEDWNVQTKITCDIVNYTAFTVCCGPQNLRQPLIIYYFPKLLW